MDYEAYERVVREQKDGLFGYARAMLRDPAEAQDLAQEAMMRLWQHRDRVTDAHAPMWMRKTTHNLCIDRIRRRRFQADGSSELSEPRDTRLGPERLAGGEELGGKIAAALGQLSPGDRAVVVLREIQALSYNEIAATLEVPLGTLKARLHRAREQLRRHLRRAGVVPSGVSRERGVAG